MNKAIPVFPKWDCKISRLDDENDNTVFGLVLKTRLRKFDDITGKWYYWDFIRPHKSNIGFSQEYINNLTQHFITEIYLTIICGKIQHGLITNDGLDLFMECETQEDELERFEKMFKNK